ncbi:MAG: N-acetylmuramoyl-L-alanine amidase [Planctomycetota bacterium]
MSRGGPVVALLLAACVSARSAAPRRGDEIVVCGRHVPAGTRVVLWSDPDGYDAYRPPRPFGARRDLPDARLASLQRAVTQLVVHYDAAGTAGNCFRVLHEVRGLSCHFLLDLDGTIYQTLDVKERAWHAGEANDRSVGVELANIGAYRDATVLRRWYGEDEEGTRVTLPAAVPHGHLPSGHVARPARPGPIRGPIHGVALVQHDFTDAQYEALARLVAALGRVFPALRPEAPRDQNGTIVATALSEAEARSFRGLLGHYHLTRHKVDPGPAFDWERLLRRARELGRSP